MRYFFSGVPGRNHGPEFERICQETTWRLLSCHGSYLTTARAFLTEIARITDGQHHIMLDSGAFTAWTKGEQVDLSELIRVYEDLMSIVEGKVASITLINLDVIPGRYGRDPTPEEISEALKKSDENYEILRKHFGDIVIPVYHQGEPLSRLKEVLQMNDYICLSPRNDLPEKARAQWAHWAHMYTGNTKTHGLATTGRHMMKAPWFSVDSATWVYVGAMGGILYHDRGQLYPIAVSDRSPLRKQLGKHIENVPKIMRDRIVAYIEECGYTLEQVATDAMKRNVVNAIAVKRMLKYRESQIVKQPLLFAQ